MPSSARPATGAESCTPGYWRNHADRWTAAIEAAKDELAAANELGCPLGGTRAFKVTP